MTTMRRSRGGGARAAALAVVLAACGTSPELRDGGRDADIPVDVGVADTGTADAGAVDAGAVDAGEPRDAGGADAGEPGDAIDVLTFSRTTGFRHASIASAAAALATLGAERGWRVTHTEDPSRFTGAALADIDVVVFLLTSGDVLDPPAELALERWVRGGGGWVGVHSASDTEYDWAFYGRLVGAYFARHPAIQPARVRVAQRGHATTAHLPDAWDRTDEWYDFVVNPRANVDVLLTVDESSYTGGGMGADHPIAWRQTIDAGRSVYTALGHTEESYGERAFLDHLAGAVEWASRARAARILDELDGVAPVGTWDRMEPRSSDFRYEVTANTLEMTDEGGANQHLVRRGVTIDPTRPYVIDLELRIPSPLAGLSSFCVSFAQGGAEGDLSAIDSHAVNVDLDRGPGVVGGTTKYMGFADGGFRQIGQRTLAWGEADVFYAMRVEVNRDATGAHAPREVTVTVRRDGAIQERFTESWSTFPWQPALGERVRLGLNTHGTDWTARELHVHYDD